MGNAPRTTNAGRHKLRAKPEALAARGIAPEPDHGAGDVGRMQAKRLRLAVEARVHAMDARDAADRACKAMLALSADIGIRHQSIARLQHARDEAAAAVLQLEVLLERIPL